MQVRYNMTLPLLQKKMVIEGLAETMALEIPEYEHMERVCEPEI